MIARLGASACETAGGGKQRAIGAERMAYNRARTHLALASRWSTKPALLSSAPCTVCGVEDVSSEHQPGGQWHGTDPMASMPKICAAYVYLGYARCIPRCSNRRPSLIAFLLPLAYDQHCARGSVEHIAHARERSLGYYWAHLLVDGSWSRVRACAHG